MGLQKINFAAAAAGIEQPFAPREMVRINDTVVRMAKVEGEFHFHVHRGEDEFFLVLDGKMELQSEQGNVKLGAGEGVLVPRGLSHRPVTPPGQPATILMVEPASTISKGD